MSKALASLKQAMASRSGVAATIQILLANIFILGINAGTGVITARILGPTGRGEQAAIIMWPQFLAYVLTLGLPSALLYNLKRYPDQASRLFSAALFLGTIMGGITTVVGVLFLPYWLTEYSSEVVLFAQLSMLVAPLASVALVFTAALQAREEFALYNAFRYLQPLLTLLALIFLALLDRLTPFNSAMSFLLTGVPIFFWVMARMWRLYHPRWYGLFPASKSLLSYGIRSYGVDVSGVLLNQLDRILVVGLLSPAAMGLYVVALSLSRMLLSFHTAVVSVLFSKASGRSLEEVMALTDRAARASTTVALLAALGLALFGPWALTLLYGQEYLDAATVFRLLALEAVLSGAAYVMSQAFMALGRPGLVTVLQGAGLVLSVPLLLLLVPFYGLEGAGLALLVAAVVRLILVVLSFVLILKVRPPGLWLTRGEIVRLVRERSRNDSSSEAADR